MSTLVAYANGDFWIGSQLNANVTRHLTRSNFLQDSSVLHKAPLLPALEKLDIIGRREDNWDGIGSPAAHEHAVIFARKVLEKLHNSISELNNPIFYCPFITSNEFGEIVFEWWREERKLTFYVTSNEIRFLRSWGTDIINQMEDDVCDENHLAGLWSWLNRN